MRQWIVCGLLLPCLAPGANGQSAAEAVRLDMVTYKGLVNEIKSFQGKVILVDFWADTCIPCKQKFPSVLALHRKYEKSGFSVVSVSVDDATDADTRESVKAFLQQQQSTCRNLLLSEKADIWAPKLKMDRIPCMFLFDQHGRLINRWTGGEIDLAAIEKRIVELLNSETK